MNDLKRAMLFFSIIFLFISCVDSIDLSQFEDIEIPVPMTVAYINTVLSKENFLDVNLNEIEVISDETNTHFEDLVSHVKGDELLIKTNFKNTFNRDFLVTYEYYNSLEELLMTSDVMLVPHNTTSIDYSSNLVEEEFDFFSNTTKVRLVIRLQDINPANILNDGEFSMSSSLNFTIQYSDE